MDFIGLFFGSFNPVHNGHLAIARYLLDEKYCREIWFVVSPRNPWKKDRTLLPEQQRLEIVQTALAADPRMLACNVEFALPKPSYTYRTLQVLSQRYPDKRFALIIGGDNLERFHLWRNYREILREYCIFVYPRPDIPCPEIHSATIKLVNAPLLNISSSGIRQKIKEGEDISGDVPEEALPLIKKYYVESLGGKS